MLPRSSRLGFVVLALWPVLQSARAAEDQDKPLPPGVTAEVMAGDRVLVWSVGSSVFRAIPEKGGRLLSWTKRRSDGSVRPIIFWPEGRTSDNFPNARGGIPILFPFSGASETLAGKHTWRTPTGEIRPMPMHGLARQGRFALSEVSAAGFLATFSPDDETAHAYPFVYSFSVRYEFRDDRLRCELRLANKGDMPLPWSAGLHPYFAIPAGAEDSRANYWIRIPSTRSWRRHDATLVAGPSPQFPQRLDEAELRATFWAALTAPEVSFGPNQGGDRIAMRFLTNGAKELSPTYSVVLWTESDDAPFFCVEPFMGPTNAAETTVGLHWVAVSQSESFEVEIEAN